MIEKEIKKKNNILKKKLIKFIKEFKKTCPECGKLYLGGRLIAKFENSLDPVHINFQDYLTCEKCPDCALKCHSNRENIIQELGRLPCLNETIEDYDDVNDYLNEMFYEIECSSAFDEDYIEKQTTSGCPIASKDRLIDLLELITSYFEK